MHVNEDMIRPHKLKVSASTEKHRLVIPVVSDLHNADRSFFVQFDLAHKKLISPVCVFELLFFYLGYEPVFVSEEREASLFSSCGV